MMTYQERVMYLTNFINRIYNLVLEAQTELAELRILLQVEKDLASKEYPGEVEEKTTS